MNQRDIKWWQRAVAYQVYPKSFCDTDGDGIGDLRGVIEKLDYIQSLGISLLYINPVCVSPMKDNGYDVADYYRIDPSFGTNEDMYELIREAKRRGIRVIMDMVLNHCSDQHEWFRRALADPEGPYGDYFYFRKGRDGQPPNNWRSIFGGSAWEKAGDTDYYYLHIFTKEQADLNWENPELREEIYRMMNFWLDKGLGGFRLDATAYMKKKEGLPSFPADGPDGLVSVKYGTLNQPGLEVYLKEMKERTYGPRGCFAVGEMEDADIRNMQDYISLKNGYFNCIFEVAHLGLGRRSPNYFWFEEEPWDCDELRDRLLGSQKLLCPGNWIAIQIENHDMPRSMEWLLKPEGRNYYGMSMLGALYLNLWGTPFIYQGQEIGMRNYGFDSIGLYNDCSSVNQYKIALQHGLDEEEALRCVQRHSRDNARYPMLWSADEKAGFTKGTPWLPIPPHHETVNVEAEERDPNSLLYFYRKLIALRTRGEYSDVLSVGEVRPELMGCHGIFAYRRGLDGRQVLVIGNNQAVEAQVELSAVQDFDAEHCCVLVDNYGGKNAAACIRMQPFQVLVLGALS